MGEDVLESTAANLLIPHIFRKEDLEKIEEKIWNKETLEL